jgi:hypothetical protein
MSEQRVHRLPVVSAEDPQKLIGLLTQSQILRWIGPNLGEAAKAVVDLGSAPVSLPSTATIKDAINLLHSKRLMGLPIIDGGSVIGDFNLGDLELLGPEQAVFHISSPLSWFLSKFRESTAPYDLTMSNTATLVKPFVFWKMTNQKFTQIISPPNFSFSGRCCVCAELEQATSSLPMQAEDQAG